MPGEKSWRDTDSWYLLKVYLDNRASAGVSKPAEDMAMYDLLRPAQDLIEKRYAAVGILEEFNTTLALFDASLGMPVCFSLDDIKRVLCKPSFSFGV